MPKDAMYGAIDGVSGLEDEAEGAEDAAMDMSPFLEAAKRAGFEGDKAAALKEAIVACMDDNAYAMEDDEMEEA